MKTMSLPTERSLTEQLRRVIEESGLTRYRIAQETGVSEATLSKFYLGQRGLSMEALDAIWDYLDLTISVRRKSKTSKRK
jgi:transcriptional regulator with XRE-family HTH domain